MPTGLSVIQFIDIYKGDWTMDWDNATATTFKVALYGALTVNFSASLMKNASPFTSGEQAGSGYAAGGMSVPGRTVTEVPTATGIVAINGTYMEWNPITTTTVRNAVIWKSDNRVLGVWDLGTPADVAAGVFRITFSSDRIVTHKVIP